MNAQEELNPEDRSEAVAASSSEAAEKTANHDPAVETPAVPGQTRNAELVEPESGASAPKVEAPRLNLMPYLAAQAEPRSEAAPKPAGPSAISRWVSGLAAGLALVAAVTAVGLYDHSRQSTVLAAKAEESASLAQTVAALKQRIDAMEAARSREEGADLRKIAAEMKAGRDAAHDLNGALAQLATRVDRVDHDQNARIDKLSDHIDHDTATRIAELNARIEKLEKRPAAPVVAALTPPPAPAKPAVVPPAAAKPETVISNETTGSIEKPKPMLHSYQLIDVQGDYALVEGRDGPQQVGPGDILPGAGRVLRLERRGRDWVLVTSLGVISGGDQSRF